MTADPAEKWKARAEKIAIELGGFGTVRDARKSLLAQRIAAALSTAYAEGEGNITAVSKASYAARREDEREIFGDSPAGDREAG